MRSMPISPSDFEWWAWLLIAMGAAFVTWIANLFEEEIGGLSISITIVSGLFAILSGAIGIIRFVRWAWNG